MKLTTRRLESLLPEALAADRYAVRREIAHLKRSGFGTESTDKVQKCLLRLEKQLQVSINEAPRRKRRGI